MNEMIRVLLFMTCCLLITVASTAKSNDDLRFNVGNYTIEVQVYTPEIIRILKYPKNNRPEKESFSVILKPEKVAYEVKRMNDICSLKTSSVTVMIDLSTGQIIYTDKDKNTLLQEKNDGVEIIPQTYGTEQTYSLKQVFLLDTSEAIYGLGQHQEGRMNQRNQHIHMQQTNMDICVPIIHSVKGYALFWDNYSPTDFIDNAQGMSFNSSSGDCIDYYFMFGENADGVIRQIRLLTGDAPMFPLWTYGYWQSKERYASQDEIVGVVKKYRDQKIPLDGIVQDWRYWGEEDSLWNSVEFLNPHFPNPQQMVDDIHRLNAHAIISVWPCFGPATNIYKEMEKKNMLLDFPSSPNGIGKVYDAYNPAARDLFWNYMNRNIFSLGMDGWWLDATEPEQAHYNSDILNMKTYLGTYRNVRNAFPLLTVGGIHEHQRTLTSDKRVFILTRSAFAGQQRYGANSWSGDIVSNWTVLRKQISGGLNFSLSGIPYWNTDIGGFYSNNYYPGGVNNPTFHELYVRWLQFATFTPMMRSHGTQTPREIYQFGKKGDWGYDVIADYINLRYRLLPYIYSTSYQVTQHAGSMMRALMMDFPRDTRVYDIDNEYLFGPSILVNPVTEPMYIGRNGDKTLLNFDEVKRQNVYLPKGNDWIDFWTGKTIKGGQEIMREVPIDIMPLYVKVGTILPMGPFVQYAEEKDWDNLEIRIYKGADGEFVLYEDENDNYNYEKGKYSTIRFWWNDNRQELQIDKRKGTFPGMLKERKFRFILVDEVNGIGINESSKYTEVKYTGKDMTIRL